MFLKIFPYLPAATPLHSTLRHPATKGQGNSGRFRPYLLMCGQAEQGGWMGKLANGAWTKWTGKRRAGKQTGEAG